MLGSIGSIDAGGTDIGMAGEYMGSVDIEDGAGGKDGRGERDEVAERLL